MMLYMRSRTRKITVVLVTVVVLVYLANVASVSNEIWKHPPFFASRPSPEPQHAADSRTAVKVNATGHVERIDPALNSKLNLPPEYRVVHLDFKGAPPKISYLRVLFPLMASAGANAILIEYEDMFPFVNNLRNASARNAYTRSDVQEINRLAAKSSLEVIPLVQTFGHLEFVLKLEEFRYYREMVDFPQEVCPNHPDVMTLVKDLLMQVRALHPESRYMHIGCDEVFHLAVCARCSAKLRKAQAQQKDRNIFSTDPRFNIFAAHVAKVARLVRDELGMIPIIWDDMLRQQGPRLIGSELTGIVEPMVWVYTDDITRLVPHYVWHTYASMFPNIWAASAFKGASGERALVPEMDRRIANTAAWLRILSGEEITGRKVRHFRGLVLTGWSRYDHFAVLCELLPASIPSLILALALLKSRQSHLSSAVAQNALTLLQCGMDMRLRPDEVPLQLTHESLASDPHQLGLADNCAFPGANVLATMKQYTAVKQQIDSLHWELTEKQGWLTPYNVKHGYSSPWRIAEGLAKEPFLMSNLEAVRNSSEKVLSQYLDSYSVREWIEQRIQPLIVKLNGLQQDAMTLMARSHWPRRPLE